MKLLLINPPELQLITADNPEFLDQERGATPPLGLLYVAAVARDQPGWDVDVVDCVGERLSYDALRRRIETAEPDLIGITVLTFTVLDVLATISVARQAAPDAELMLGGPHAHIYPRESLGWQGVSIVATGEGEAVVPQLLAAFPDRERMAQVQGLVFRNGAGDIVDTGRPLLMADLDSLPFPARDMTDVNAYSSVVSRHNPISTMITSRGCPYRCRYCDRPNMGKRFRAHSADYVVREMAECAGLGVGEVFIYDDTFTVDRERVMEVCRQKVERCADLVFDIRTRVDRVDQEMLDALRSAGCERVHYGVEAGTTRIQQVLGKGITLEQATEAVRMTRRAGMKSLAYFMIGAPGETREDIHETMRFAKRLNPDLVSITILTPFPETAIYAQALDEGVLSDDYFREFARNPRPDFQVRYWEKELSREELLEELRKAYREFYGRPGWLLREAMHVRSVREFRAKLKMGLKVLGLGGRDG